MKAPRNCQRAENKPQFPFKCDMSGRGVPSQFRNGCRNDPPIFQAAISLPRTGPGRLSPGGACWPGRREGRRRAVTAAGVWRARAGGVVGKQRWRRWVVAKETEEERSINRKTRNCPQPLRPDRATGSALAQRVCVQGFIPKEATSARGSQREGPGSLRAATGTTD